MNKYPKLVVNQAAILNNVGAIRAQLAKHVKLMAVVKANAYGLGAKQMTQFFVSSGINNIAVSRLEEALEIAHLIQSASLLIFEPLLSIENLDSRFEYTITDISYLKQLIKTDQEISIQINVNTGMNRLGMSETDLHLSLRLIKNSKLKLMGIYTHLATSDEFENESCKNQLQRFQTIYEKLKPSFQNCIFHAANSGAIFNYPESHFDMVRSGIALYGSYPTNLIRTKWKLKPVVKLISQIVQIKKVEKGEYIGYSNTYKLARNSQIAVVKIGYADGYNRKLSNTMTVEINDKLYPVVGLISMDLITVDIGNDNHKIGDEAILIQDDLNSKISLELIAKQNQTIPYEILTLFTDRVTRSYT